MRAGGSRFRCSDQQHRARFTPVVELLAVFFLADELLADFCLRSVGVVARYPPCRVEGP